MKFRRILLVVLAFAALLSFAACTVQRTVNPTQDPTAEATVPGTKVPTQKPTAASTKKPVTTVKPTQVPTATVKPTQQASATPTKEPTAGGTLYQLADSKGGQMNSYVIQTQNTKLIIMDGGYDRNKQDLINLAKEITGQQKPEIEAWFFSHTHSDHVNAFSSMFNESATKNALTVKKLYYNITSRDYVVNKEPDSLQTYDNFVKALNTFPANKKVIVQEGDKIRIDGLIIEVLITPDETKSTVVPINDASVIYRLNIGNQRVLFLGDAYETAGVRFYRGYKDDLTADVVQMAHHGSQGIQRSIYKKIEAKACLWPSPQFMWTDENQAGGGGSYSLETVSLHRYMRYDLGIKHHFISRDGVQKLVFPLDLD